MFIMFAGRALLATLRLRPSQRVAYYYMKPKKKKGPSTQAWLAFAGVSTTLAGIALYELGEHQLESSLSSTALITS